MGRKETPLSDLGYNADDESDAEVEQQMNPMWTSRWSMETNQMAGPTGFR